MKQFFKFFFASLLALTVAGVLFIIVFFAMIGAVTSSLTSGISSEEKVFTQEKSILSIDLSDQFMELGQKNMLAMFTGGKNESPGLSEILRSIEHAKTDDKIKGIYLKTNGYSNGLATAQQLRDALKNFKESGKFIYAYGDYIPQADYYIASVADSIFINPLGSVEIKGLASRIMFFKGAFDKLEIKPVIFYAGQFKSATEPFRMEKMSEQNRIQLAELQDGIWEEYLNAFSEFTKAEKSEINSWTQQGLIQDAHDAIKYKLISGTKYKDQIEDLLREKVDLKEDDDVRLANIMDYARNTPSNTNTDHIALLIAEGNIVDGSSSNSEAQIASEDIIKEIRKIKKDDKIKAVVLRINSPGGSALASEVILRELNLLNEKKPLIVSMGDLAASGGYYIACQADSIFAMPTTITGSIGVFGMMFNTQSFFNNKLGITYDTEKNAPYADFPNLNREMTAQEKTFIQRGVDSIYYTFKSRVAEGRNKSIEYVDSVGQGRIWTGYAALENGLIDGIGDLNRAFESAAAIADLESYKIVTFPSKEDKFDKIFKALSNNSISEKIMAEQFLQQELGQDYKWFSTLRDMRKQQSNIWMLMPFIPEVK